MADQDTRVMERLPAAMRIRLKYADVETFIQRYAVNISRGGIFIATRSPKPVGALLRFEFQLASSAPVIRGEGQVVWVKPFDPMQPRRVHGMGVRFLRLDAESREVVDRALKWKSEHATAAESAGSPPPSSPDQPQGQTGALARHDAAEPIAENDESAADESATADASAAEPGDSHPEPGDSHPEPDEPMTTDPDESSAKTFIPEAAMAKATPDLSREAISELVQSTQSQVVRAARHIVELTAAHDYYPEDAELAALLRPVRVALPPTGREAARLLRTILRHAALDGPLPPASRLTPA